MDNVGNRNNALAIILSGLLLENQPHQGQYFHRSEALAHAGLAASFYLQMAKLVVPQLSQDKKETVTVDFVCGLSFPKILGCADTRST